MAYKQFGYKTGINTDRSYSITEKYGRYYVVLDLVPRAGGRVAGPTKTIYADFPQLSAAQQFIDKKVL